MDIKVTASGGASGPIDWDIDGKKPHKASHEFKEKTGPHEIKFKLGDKTGRGLKFDAQQPIWDEKNTTGCPASQSNSDQIEVQSCSDRELTISNANSGDPCTIHYQLNFVDSEGRPEVVDPEFKNGGGGGSL